MNRRWGATTRTRNENVEVRAEDAILLAKEITAAIARRLGVHKGLSGLEIRLYNEAKRMTNVKFYRSFRSIESAIQKLDSSKAQLLGIDQNYFKDPVRDFRKPPEPGELL